MATSRAPLRLKAILCLYLPTAVAALADALTAVQTIGTAKDLVYSNFALSADKLLLGEAGGQHPNPDETLTEAEFLISVLKEKGIVDDMTVQAIRLQFAHITRHDTSTNSNKVLDDKIVFLELCSQGRILSPKQGGATKVIIEGETLEVDFVDTSAVDGGFQEWRVDMARQCVGHGARPAPLDGRWDLAGEARSRLPRVATVLPGGAADRAGLQAGDRLVGVTGGGRRLSLRKWAAAADRPPLERITERMGCRALHPKHRKHPDETRPVSTGGRDETRPVSTGGGGAEGTCAAVPGSYHFSQK